MPGHRPRVVAGGYIGKDRARRGNPQSTEKNCVERDPARLVNTRPEKWCSRLHFIKNSVFSVKSSRSHHSVTVLRARRAGYGTKEGKAA